MAGIESKVSFMEEYVYTMERQAGQIADAMPDGVSFSDMALGGGTPLLLPEHLLERVFVIARDYFGIKNGTVPVAVETSPNQTTESKLVLLKDNGVTRISIGVQSFNNIELKETAPFPFTRTCYRGN